MSGRVLAIDPGERRVGFAVSDPLGITAQGLPTFDRKTGGDLVAHVRALADEYQVELVVVGNPIAMSGREGEASAKARQLGDEIRRRLGVEVKLWDERLSSAEAQRALAGTRAGKKAIDRVAAVLILQGYLDAHAGPSEAGER
jgi:putative Holliday junction resolvase